MSGAATPPTRIAMDITPLAGPITGVGQMVRHLVAGLAGDPSLDLTGLLISWRGRARTAGLLPPGWTLRALPLPARLTHASWRHIDRPRLQGFDVVHGPNYVVPPARGAVRLVTVHDLTAWRYPDLVDHHSRHYPRQLDRALSAGAHVHAVSHHVGRELHEELGVDSDRIHVVPNGLALPRRGDGGRGRALVGGPYVLAVGTIEPRKDHASLVRAMAAIWPIHPDLRLVLAGGEGWGQADLDRAVQESGAGDRLVRLGYVSDTDRADLLAGAELVCYPSLYEGFGLPVLEAMQAGIPVVSTTAGAIPEVAGRAAVLVEPRDPMALAGAMLSVLEDDGLRARLAEAGRARAAHFSWDTTVAGLIRTYRALLADDRADRVDGRTPGRSEPEGTTRAAPVGSQ